jgi:DNA-binding NarL/FixJ family response regulator
MPPSFTVEGLDAARRIARMRPGTGVLVLSQYLESGYAVELLTGAASHVGYLLKDHLAEGTVLVDALTRVAAGECLVDPAVVVRLVTHPRAGGPLAPLTAREKEVLSMVAEGLANPTIAERLDISRRTLESHVRQIFIKLGISESPDGDRRVLAVLTYLRATTTAAG